MGIDKGILSALADHEKKIHGPHFILFAEKPLHPGHDQIRMNHDQVLNHLYHAGYDAHGIKSHIFSPSKSIIIYQIGPQEAEELHKLAAKLGQNQSIYSDGTAQEMRFHYGPFSGRSHYGQGSQIYHLDPPEDNYHTLPGGSCHVQHNFDYNSHHLSGQLDKWSKHGKE